MRRPHDENRNREVGRDFTEIERELIMDIERLAKIGRRLQTQPEDTVLVLALDAAIVLREFPWLNGPSGLFPEAEPAGKIGS
jgi:hypothetical protein